VYGPVRTVVWQGSVGNRCPYADSSECSTRAYDLPELAYQNTSFPNPDNPAQVTR